MDRKSSPHDSSGNPCGNDSPFPCDDAGHGTHTIGIAIGDDGAGNQIGMFGGQMDGAAPGAQLVSARACSFGPGCTAVALTDGMVLWPLLFG